jgi:hypothetical protein
MSNSGDMFSKDLGAETEKGCMAMTEYNPDKTWTAVEY